MNEKSKTTVKQVFKNLGRLYWMTKEHFGWGFLRFIGGISSALIGVFGSWIMGTVIDVALSGDFKRFHSFMFLIALQITLRGIINYVNPLTGRRYSVYSGRKIRTLAIEKINRLPISYYEKKHTAETISRLANDIDSLQEFYSDSIAGIWSFVPSMLISSTWLLCSIDPLLTLICGSIIPIIWFFVGKISIPIGDTSKNVQKSIAEYNSYLRDFLEGIHIYIAFAMKKIFASKFEKACRDVVEESLKMSRMRSKAIGLNIFSFIIPQALAYGIGGIFVVNGRLTIGQLVIFANVLFPLLNSIRQLSGSWADFLTQSGRAQHLYELLDSPEERADGEDFTDNPHDTVIEFENVRYSYVDGNPVLTDTSFKICEGKKVALVGSSGSGKTTVHKLILGYYDNYGGIIRFYDKDIREWNLKALRNQVSVVTQEVYLFCDTIMENIRLGNPQASDEEVINAAKAAYAHDFIMEFTDGYKTPVGERGMKLSGGQRQRIAIARAMLKNAPVLLLDEPTSALDTKAEYYVQKALERLEEGKTVFITAHRLSTIINADEILVLDSGRIVESGTHEELINRKTKYYELYNRQVFEHEGKVTA
ncbi:MAG: ABC transporter ATP-binding protein [Firmicutes bacterium]|nr:ABC transporter ATP-binding protein [Bacillota bacterium]